MNITINSEKDIDNTVSYNSWLSRPNIRIVSITPNKISEEACHQYEKRIKYLFNDCGCVWASPIFIFAFFIALKILEVGTIAFWEELAISLFVAVLVAFVAKFTALWWSYRRLSRTLIELKRINW